MPELPFIKMHGAGNDYVFVDGYVTSLPDHPETLAAAISHRHFGIGADGLILIVPSSDSDADVEMRMWNCDGSPGAMCGNGARCVALWMHLCGRISRTCRIRTATRVIHAEALSIAPEKRSGLIRLDMGGTDAPGPARTLPGIVTYSPDTGSTQPVFFTPVSLGNSHTVVFGLSAHR